MREIHVSAVTDMVAKLAIDACCLLPDDFFAMLRDCAANEPSPTGKDVLEQLIENATIAKEEMVPICQDTGLAVVFADIGQDVHFVGGSFEEAVNKGVAKGYKDGYLRKSSVAEPLFERKNTGDNTPAIIHIRLIPGDAVHLKVAPKGFGSENKSAVKMLVPADGIAGVKQFVVETVKKAGSSPCPPTVVGVGVGGTMEVAALCAKRAAARDASSANADARYAQLENELLESINKLGIGPQGLGGKTTSFAVNVEYAATHIAGLPVAVNINCHAARHAEATL